MLQIISCINSLYNDNNNICEVIVFLRLLKLVLNDQCLRFLYFIKYKF